MHIQVYSGRWDGEILRRSIHWVRLGLITDPQGVAFVGFQAYQSLTDHRDTEEFLDITVDEACSLVSMVVNSRDQENFQRRLYAYCFPDSRMAS